MSASDKLFLKKLVEKELTRLVESPGTGDEVDSAIADFEQKNSIKSVQTVATTLLKALKKFEESVKDDHPSLNQHVSQELVGLKNKLIQLVKDDNHAAGFVKQEVTPKKTPKKVTFKPVGKTL
jgi:hypothetical protein